MAVIVTNATCFLVNGPEATSPARRETMIRAMAGDLLAYAAYADRDDAIRCLLSLGHNRLDVMILSDEARQVAVQHLVAEIMSDG